ncbi:hypothetical protein [Cupriavidus sp. USMAHM13]|uniref:hypothetical protein n=1 Tax=Cupriavidus sp. USMAHM13 TaxID=1389192 RepID=UPI0009F21F05|nr:hypothetical protein [Cupriavidus sp. USMAHM13]
MDAGPVAQDAFPIRLAMAALRLASMILAWYLPLVLACSFANPALACLPGKHFDLYFSAGSVVPSATEVRRLALWVAELRRDVPAQQVFAMSGYADSAEPRAHELSRLRLDAVHRLLTGWRFNQVPIATHYGVYPAGTVSNGKRVEISLLPACPNDCCGNGERRGTASPA